MFVRCDGVFAITCLSIFAEFDVSGFQVCGIVICHLGWEGDSQSLSCTGAGLEAGMEMLAAFSQGASRDVGRITPHGVERWRSTVGERLCVECVFTVLHWAHMPETPLYSSVCLVRCNSDW